LRQITFAVVAASLIHSIVNKLHSNVKCNNCLTCRQMAQLSKLNQLWTTTKIRIQYFQYSPNSGGELHTAFSLYAHIQ